MKITGVLILRQAVNDLSDGKAFYDRTQPGVGDYFWDSLTADIGSLVVFGGAHMKVYGYYRMLAKRFPFAVYYEIDGETARVVAVLPMRRNPLWIERKLGST